MNFKELKNKLLGRKNLNEGSGFVRLKNLLDEATFPWDKFSDKPATWDQRTKAKEAEKNRGFSDIGRKTGSGPGFKHDTSSDPPTLTQAPGAPSDGTQEPKPDFKNDDSAAKSAGSKRKFNLSQFLHEDEDLAKGLIKSIRDALPGRTIDHRSIDIIRYGNDRWIAEFPFENDYERFYVHPDFFNSGMDEHDWTIEGDFDDALFDDFE